MESFGGFTIIAHFRFWYADGTQDKRKFNEKLFQVDSPAIVALRRDGLNAGHTLLLKAYGELVDLNYRKFVEFETPNPGDGSLWHTWGIRADLDGFKIFHSSYTTAVGDLPNDSTVADMVDRIYDTSLACRENNGQDEFANVDVREFSIYDRPMPDEEFVAACTAMDVKYRAM
ncbi:hypothetical protein OEZ86_002627 [Tetradesmus obliquus]|nr:hypothetical protein OEZ86_002627 [Tetradesmus obliquus]